MHTSRYLDKMGVFHRLVVEESEYKNYLEAVGGNKKKLIVLDMEYKKKYEYCDEFGTDKPSGSGPARNFIWDYSISEGYDWHWIMDDNILKFCRFNHNLKVPTTNPAFWRAMEDFMLRYKNIAMGGPNYFMFVLRKVGNYKPFTMNTRIYSCNFIRNDIPFRWRGRYNEDTILSLDVLKAGWCTVQFNAFLQKKMATQSLPGGNTDELYKGEGVKIKGYKYWVNGTMDKSKMLARVHPDVAKVVWKFHRWHHEVDYKPFKKNKLILRDGLKLKKGENNYGMVYEVLPMKTREDQNR